MHIRTHANRGTEMRDPKVTYNEPHDRLTELAQKLIQLMESDPAYDGIRAVFMLEDDEEGGIGVHGIDDMREAGAIALHHSRRLLEHTGVDMHIFVPPEIGQG
jgi:hypothetical protein